MFSRLLGKKMDDATLVRKALTSDWYFGKLYDRYFQDVYAFVRFRINDDHDAEDIVSEVFMILVDKLESFDTERGTKFRTRLLSIAHNKILQYYRDKKQPPIQLDESMDSPVEFDINQILTNKKLYNDILETVQKMPDQSRSVFFLKYVEGYKNKEIAEMLDIHPKTVSSTLSQIKKKLNNCFE